MAKRHLLEQQTVRADLDVRVNDDAVGVGDQKSAANACCQGNVGTSDDGPEAMTQRRRFHA
jgi:hypothetical protein